MIDQELNPNGAQATEPNQIHSEIHKALSLRHGANDRICVCCYTRNGDGKFHNIENFVTGIDAAAQVIESNYKLPEVGAIWSNLQKLQPHATARSKETVEAYTHILVDVDRREKKDSQGDHTNATDAERAVLLEVAYKIPAFLAHGEFGWGRGVMADSGNGYHLDWPIQPLDPARGKQLYSALLKVLAAKFESPDLNMQIDVSMTNETRVITVWGTWNRKYPHTEERPQRQTKILSAPRWIDPLSAVRIELMIGFDNLDDAPASNSTISTEKKAKSDLPQLNPDWLENYGPEHLCEWGMPYTPLDGSYEKNGETHYRLDNCITSKEGVDGFHQHHQGGNKRQTELILGHTLGYECFSDDCTEFGIGEWLRRLQELKGEKYPHRIFVDDAEELAEVFGAEEDPTDMTPIEETPVVEPKEDAAEYTMVTHGNSSMIGVRFSDVFSREIKWVWKGLIPRGKGVILQGPPGVAKSMASLSIAATLMERSPYEFNLASPFYALLDPTDVVQFVYEDTVYQERLKNVGVGQNYAVKTTGVSQLPQAYASTVTGAPVSPVVVTVLNLLEIESGGYLLQEDGTHILITV